MKIIVFENNYALHNNATEAPLYNNAPEDHPVVYTLPDTALLKDHRPFFVPDFTQRCSMRVQMVVRISRLGRSISTRFAHRYYDALSVGVTFTAEDLLEELRAKGQPWELAKGFDGAAALGDFTPLTELEDGLSTAFSIQQGDTVLQSGTGADMLQKVDDLIAWTSQFYTLKQGDFLFTGCPTTPTLVQPDAHIEGFLGTHKVLSFNIK